VVFADGTERGPTWESQKPGVLPVGSGRDHGRVGDDKRLQREALALGHQSLDVATLFSRLQPVIAREAAFDGCCWMTFDPATILPTGHIPYRSIPPEQVPRLAENEYFEDDVNKFSVLARAESHVGSMWDATDGRPEQSIRYRVLLDPNGFHDELRVALERDGACWGGLALYRRSTEPFSAGEAAAMTGVAAIVADGIRRAILTTALADNDAPDAPGLVLLGPGNSVDAISPAAEHWLADLVVSSESESGDELASVVYAVASHARRAGQGELEAGPAVARARTDGGWRCTAPSWTELRTGGCP
jgi:hypothetical protein